jgi:DNA topoisomerase IB
VWICPFPNGHLQAVGTDAAGRRQYRYHDAWRARRDADKFDRMLDFGRALPDLRAACAKRLARVDGVLEAEVVLAGAVRLLDLGFFRIGGEQSGEEESFGLTTLRKDHASVDGDTVRFSFPAKGGIQRLQAVADPQVRQLVRRLKRRRGGGDELIAYKDRHRWVDVTARDVNEFLKEHGGETVTAKDFRTWHATVLAAVAVAVSGWAESKRARDRAVRRAVEEVAHYLGNTPTVARNSYVDPRVFDRYRSGWTIGGVLDALGEDAEAGHPALQGAVERGVLDLLADDRASDAVVRGPLLTPTGDPQAGRAG